MKYKILFHVHLLRPDDSNGFIQGHVYVDSENETGSELQAKELARQAIEGTEDTVVSVIVMGVNRVDDETFPLNQVVFFPEKGCTGNSHAYSEIPRTGSDY